jgi:hypothetical protein
MRLYGRGRFVQCCTMIVLPSAGLDQAGIDVAEANFLLRCGASAGK